jgi:Tat protein translocase TatB subunit
MFNLGFSELLLLGLIALIFIGPNQLPEVARTIGRLLNEWKRATSDFQSSITTHLTDDIHQRRKDTHHSIHNPPAEPGPELPIGAHPVSEGEPEKKS